MSLTPSCVRGALVALLAGSAAAAHGAKLPFPLVPTSPVDALFGVELALDPSAADELRGLEDVTLTGAVLGDGRSVDLELRRVRAATNGIEVRIDGALGAWAPPTDSTCWMGRVAGDPASEVFLGVSRFGSRGWIRESGETWHVLAARGANDDWSDARARLVGDAALTRLGNANDFVCQVDSTFRPAERELVAPHTGAAALTSDVLECWMAIETDYQLFQKFASVTAEQNYLNQLFAAANARFLDDISTSLNIVYLGLHTTANDGWVSTDNGAGSGAMLDEFRNAWVGNIPGNAHLAHFVSGAGLGGGVAWLDVLCNPNWSFAVSGDLAGNTPFPVTQGPLTWDFYVFAHETGHNFAAPHTHELCPPADQCAPSGSFGACQSTQVCTSSGTIMSYCHLCNGGTSNIGLVFHPANASIMRNAAEASCIPVLCQSPANYCPTSPNSYDVFGAVIGYQGSTRIAQNDFVLYTTSVPPNASCLYFYGQNQTLLPFGNGSRCVANPVFRLPVHQAGFFGESVQVVDYGALPSAGQISAGQTWNFQLWFRNPAGGGAGFNTSDALRVKFCP